MKELYMKNYKKLLIIPLIIFAISLFIIFQHNASTGEIVEKDVTLKGGLTITIYSSKVIPQLDAELEQRFPQADINVRQLKEFGSDEQIGILIEAAEVEEETLKPALENIMGIEFNHDNYSVEEVGSILGNSFYKQMRTALILAFIFMGIVVLIAFRALVPAFTIVFCAFADMVFAVAMLNTLGMRLSTAGIAALLMLIGYSIDTDIVITTKALKRKEEGSIIDRIVSGTKTGLTMTISTVAALSIGYFVSQSYVIKEMFIIIIFGLIFDVIMTYLFNTGILVWWIRRKKKH